MARITGWGELTKRMAAAGATVGARHAADGRQPSTEGASRAVEAIATPAMRIQDLAGLRVAWRRAYRVAFERHGLAVAGKIPTCDGPCCCDRSLIVAGYNPPAAVVCEQLADALSEVR